MLAHRLTFTPERDAEVFAEIPPRPGVFLLRPQETDAEPYVSKSSNLRRRIARLLARPEEAGVSKRLNLRERCAGIEFAETGSDLENIVRLYRLLREHFPKTYAKRLRLSPPALIKVDWENAYPRAYVTTRLGRLGAANTYIGPFRSRAAAEKYANDALDLFKSRRCTFELNPDPAFPGCVYSEMKMCLAPCFQGCTDEEYRAEVGRVQEFFVTRGQSLLAPLAASRDEASEKLEFEAAKMLHERVEKIKAIAREGDELAHRIEQLDCVIVQPGAAARGVALFRFNGGQLCGPAEASDPSAVAAGSAEWLARLEAVKKISAAECMEHLSILKRWYYRGQRVGEIIFRNPDGSWPVRRIVNACERVTAPRRHAEAEPDAAGDGHAPDNGSIQ